MAAAMAAGGAGRGLSLASLRRLRQIWRNDLHRISMADLRAIDGSNPGGVPNTVEAARRTHYELKVRIGHRLKDFLFLPYKVMVNEHFRSVYNHYVGLYVVHEDFPEPTTQTATVEYWMALARVLERHTSLTHILGRGRQQLVRLDPSLAGSLDAFLDRFYTSRIGTHLLCSNFLNMGQVPPGQRKPAGVAMGVLQPTSPARLVRDLASSIAGTEEECNVPMDMDMDDAQILYVPIHLRGIFREVLRNAMGATASEASLRGVEPEPVRVKMRSGNFGIFVTISDRGGGIPDVKEVWKWGAVDQRRADGGLSSVEEDDEDLDDLHPAVLPAGFGLPLARLTARYFGGDVRLQTLVGYGTNAYIHIPQLEEEDMLQP